MRGEYWDYSLDLAMPPLCRIPGLAAANRGPEIEHETSIIKSSMFWLLDFKWKQKGNLCDFLAGFPNKNQPLQFACWIPSTPPASSPHTHTHISVFQWPHTHTHTNYKFLHTHIISLSDCPTHTNCKFIFSYTHAHTFLFSGGPTNCNTLEDPTPANFTHISFFSSRSHFFQITTHIFSTTPIWLGGFDSNTTHFWLGGGSFSWKLQDTPQQISCLVMALTPPT